MGSSALKTQIKWYNKENCRIAGMPKKIPAECKNVCHIKKMDDVLEE